MTTRQGGGGVDVDQVIVELAGEWIAEIKTEVTKKLELEEEVERRVEKAWDDVNEGWELPVEKVKAARSEEVSYMEGRGIWTVRPVSECWEKTGRKPVSVRWVDTDKGFMGGGGMEVRSRLVAIDFKGGDKDRDDLFAGSPPLEAKRM